MLQFHIPVMYERGAPSARPDLPTFLPSESANVKINTTRGLEVLPVGAVISDNGCLAAKTPTGAWVYGDGECAEPDLPVHLVGIPES